MMRQRSIGLLLTLVALLLWSGPAQAAPTSSSQDPAQLSTAAVLFVKVDPKSGTDTIIVVNRQQAGSGTTTGSAITVHVRFYDSGCHLRFDNNVSVTPQGFVADTASHLFGVSEPGVILADFADADFQNPSKTSKFALSAVVLDGNFGALYERQGAPLLQPNARGTATLPSPPFPPGIPVFSRPVWGGFSNQDIDDWFIGGFTLLQMICPGSFDTDTDLRRDMFLLGFFGGDPSDDIASFSAFTLFSSGFPVVNVYDAKEVLRRSIHDVPCFCNTDSAFFGKDSRFSGYAGDFADVLVSMKAVGVGTFHWGTAFPLAQIPAPISVAGNSMAWRVIGDSRSVWWNAQLRRTPESSGCDTEGCVLFQLIKLGLLR